MHKITPKIVLVEAIHTNMEESFPPEVIEEAAHCILEGEGIINPLIVKRRGYLDEYDLVDGTLQYYAAKRAAEIDIGRGERIDAYIMERDNAHIIEAQIHLFRGTHTPPAITEQSALPVNVQTAPNAWGPYVANPPPSQGASEHASTPAPQASPTITLSVAALQDIIRNEVTPLLEKINTLEHQLNHRLEAIEQKLEALTPTTTEGEVKPRHTPTPEIIAPPEHTTPATPAPVATTTPAAMPEYTPDSQTFATPNAASKQKPEAWIDKLNHISSSELSERVKRHKKSKQINKTQQKSLIERRDQKPFQTHDDLKNIDGIGSKALACLKEILSEDAIVQAGSAQTPSDSTNPAETTPRTNQPVTAMPALAPEPLPDSVKPAVHVDSPGKATEGSVTPGTDAENLADKHPIAPATKPDIAREPELTAPIPHKAAPVSRPPDTTAEAAPDPLLDYINKEDKRELAVTLTRAKIPKPIMEAILTKRPFNSLKELKEIKGLTKTRLENIRKFLKI